MANVVMKSLTPAVSPKGKAMYAKLNSTIDEYEGKKKYVVNIIFDDDAVAEKFKNQIDAWLAEAKDMPEFKDKKWRTGDDLRASYFEDNNGKLNFKFQTNAFYRDKDTGEQVQKFIPIVNTMTKKQVPHDVRFANGSEMRIAFTPTAYWMTKDSNGLNLYINKIAVDKLLEYGGSDDFSEFGIKVSTEEAFDNEFEDMPI